MANMPAMKPVDMKISAAAMKKQYQPMPAADYGWGLSITLNSAQLKKLGVTELPDAGEKCILQCEGKITNVSSSASESNANRSVTIQITKLAMACEDTDDETWKKVKKDRKDD